MAVRLPQDVAGNGALLTLNENGHSCIDEQDAQALAVDDGTPAIASGPSSDTSRELETTSDDLGPAAFTTGAVFADEGDGLEVPPFLSVPDPAARLGHHKSTLDHLVEQEKARRAARHAREADLLSADLSPADLFLALIRGRQQERTYHAPLFDRSHPAVDLVLNSPDILHLLLGFLRDPFDPANLSSRALSNCDVDFLAAEKDVFATQSDIVNANALETVERPDGQSAPDASGTSSSALREQAGSSADYYLRAIDFPTQRLGRSFLGLYARNYPADIVVVELIEAEIARVHRSDDDPLALLYFGTTTMSTPIGRALQDAANGQHTTITNFLDLLKKVRSAGPTSYGDFTDVKSREFAVPALSLPADSVLDLNSILLEGLEMLGIASVSAVALNSARGGRLFRLDPAPLQEMRELVAKHGADWPSLQVLAPVDEEVDDSRRRAIEGLMTRQLEFWREHPDEAGKTLDPGTKGGANALRAILADATAGKTRLDGRGFGTFEVIVSKDVPGCCLDGFESMADLDIPVARGPFLRAQVDRAVQGFDLSQPFSLRVTAALFDFWAFNLKHKRVDIAVCFAIQHLHLQRPLLLTTRSGKIANLLRTRIFEQALAATQEADAFVNGRLDLSLDLLVVICTITELKWRETKPGSSIRIMGCTAIVQYSHLPNDLALHVATMDEGFHKYDPSVSDLVVDLVQLTAAKAAFAREALGRLLAFEYGATGVPAAAAPRREFLREARRRCEARSVATGLEARLLRARDELATAFGALNAARQLSAGDRRLADDEDRERKRRSESAHLGVANRAAQLEFVGPPLPAPVMSVLELHHSAPDDGFLLPKSLSLAVHPVLSDPLDPATLRPRLVQLVDLLAEHTEATLDGLESPVSALPTTGAPVASREWVGWFCRAPEGVEVARSASKAGWAGGRDWDAEARALQSEQQRAREEQKRASRG
ncbi:hypothetical protein BMF94_6498, partial [Rhodotorula taiwanensis]